MRRNTLLALCFAAGLAGTASAQDIEEGRYTGYYYPPITSEEVFTRKIAETPDAPQAVRVNFVTAMTKAQLAAPESPRFVIFEKGQNSQHLIIVALDDDIFRTIFRARALLAQVSSNLRGTDFFREQKLDIEGTLYDMLQVMGFEDLVLSDGATWSHQVHFKPAE